MEEWKIGEIRQIDNEWYQCVEHKGCHSCAFALSHGIGIECGFNGDSHCVYRSDGKHVIFKKLEKVGEPYEHYEKLYQCYKLPMETEIRLLPNNCYPIGKDNLVEIEIKQTKEDMEDKKLNLKPFDIQKAREGKPVCTRDGRKARIICFDMNSFNNHIIVALITEENGTESIYSYTSEGKWKETKTENDLMMLPEKKEGWAIIRKYDIYETEEQAEDAILNSHVGAMIRKITWEE